MSDLKNDLKNVPYIKQFFGEYLDLRKLLDLLTKAKNLLEPTAVLAE